MTTYLVSSLGACLMCRVSVFSTVSVFWVLSSPGPFVATALARSPSTAGGGSLLEACMGDWPPSFAFAAPPPSESTSKRKIMTATQTGSHCEYTINADSGVVMVDGGLIFRFLLIFNGF